MKKSVAIAALLSGVVLVACKGHKDEQAPLTQPVTTVEVSNVMAASSVASAAESAPGVVSVTASEGAAK
jgi:hypothetical protein